MDNRTNVICFSCEAECRVWKPIFEEAGITLISVSMPELSNKQRLEEIRKTIVKLIETSRPVVLYNHLTMDIYVEEYFVSLPKEALLVPVGGSAVVLGCATALPEHVEAINKYLLYLGDENVRSAGDYIRKHLLGDERVPHIRPPMEKPFDGIFSFDNSNIYDSPEGYFAADGIGFDSYVGLLIHRNNWVRNDHDSARELAACLKAKNIGVIPVFSNPNTNCRNFGEVVETYFYLNGTLKIEALINLQLFSIRAEEGRSVAEQSIFECEKLGIPVISPIHSHFLTAKKWLESPVPISGDMPSSLIAPEMAGMIEPIIISARSEDSGKVKAIPERCEFLAGRVARLVRLRTKPNSEKKLVIMLHNSVCTGVEATIGKAYGLDSFESTVKLLGRLESEGYQTSGYPQTGEELHSLFMEKKAFSDFRWTAVEDIINSGGCLYRMPVVGEYDKYYAELPNSLQEYMEKTWGEPPGEGMTLDGDLILTGLQFGNVTVMVQPKRGCYGAKCTGEVCKILHDPACPPPHQYLATYRYIENTADACIDVGAHGSLENLPGKSNGLSGLCWPHVVQGLTPSLYIYNAGVTNESPLVKRRMSAVITDHLPPPSTGVDDATKQLDRRIGEYFNAKALNNSQYKELETDIRAMIEENPASARILERADNFEQGLHEVSSAIAGADSARQICSLHVFGEIPDEQEIENFIKEVYQGDGVEYDPDSSDAERIREGLRRTDNEMDMLLSGLSGGYIPAGEGGMPDENGRNILPTGRNMFNVNNEKIPSKTAYERGKQLANQLIDCYKSDEGKLPEKIAVNMISLDITRTNGEQLSQFLYLLGIEPIWDKHERVKGLRVMSLAELSRPRIDITVRISGVLRDTWPMAVEMMDEAVLLVTSLDESDNDNYILKHLREYRAQNTLQDDNDRRGAIRIFGDAPGTYGAGVDLALLASAWKDESDLVKYFIQASAFAYGKNLDGKKCVREFIDNAKQVDLTCDTTSSYRRNSLAGNFGTQVQGGYRLLAKHLGKKEIRQYQSTSERGRETVTESLADNLKRNTEQTLLNEFWKESTMQRGYDGAADIMQMMQNVFSSQCVTDCFADELLDRLTNEYVNDSKMREWLSENNQYALEEIARRMLELYTREKWNPDEETLENLKANYLIIEGDLEEGVESAGDIQGGNVEILNDADIETWKEQLAEVERHIV